MYKKIKQPVDIMISNKSIDSHVPYEIGELFGGRNRTDTVQIVASQVRDGNFRNWRMRVDNRLPIAVDKKGTDFIGHQIDNE